MISTPTSLSFNRSRFASTAWDRVTVRSFVDIDVKAMLDSERNWGIDWTVLDKVVPSVGDFSEGLGISVWRLSSVGVNSLAGQVETAKPQVKMYRAEIFLMML